MKNLRNFFCEINREITSKDSPFYTGEVSDAFRDVIHTVSKAEELFFLSKKKWQDFELHYAGWNQS